MLRDLDHKTLSHLRELGFENRTLCVAVSGGCDSMVLLSVLHKISPLLKSEVCVVHIHHGWKQGKQGQYRDQAWKTVKQFCEGTKSMVPGSPQQGIGFYSNLVELNPPRYRKEPEQTLHSEEEMREFRLSCFEDLKNDIQLKFEKPLVFALAHHSEDLLETRLIRLVRGVGPEGLPSMEALSENKLRPFLEISKEDLRAYAGEEKVPFVEDPSNKDMGYFRNWLREEWLPQLENKRPGSLHRMGMSLNNISKHNLEADKDLDLVTESGIPLETFLVLGREQKQQVLATYMRALRMKNYGTSHIQEVIKRLDTPRKEHKFSLLKHQWEISAGRIKASPV